MCVLVTHRSKDTEREREKEKAAHKTHVPFISPQASSYLCRQSPPTLIKTNVRRGCEDNDRSAWISAQEKTAGHGTDGTRIASRTRHLVPRVLPPTSAGAGEETVALRVAAGLENQPAAAFFWRRKPVITRSIDNFGAVLDGLRNCDRPVSGIHWDLPPVKGKCYRQDSPAARSRYRLRVHCNL